MFTDRYKANIRILHLSLLLFRLIKGIDAIRFGISIKNGR
jgi:hypothetical protein